MAKLEIHNKREYLIAEAYLEIAICLIQDLETYCAQDNFLEKIYEQNKLHDIYQRAFYYFNKGCERNLSVDSVERELFFLSKDYVEGYLNRCSFNFIQNFDSYSEDIKNTSILNDLNAGIEYLNKSIKLMKKDSLQHVSSTIAQSHYKSNIASFHLVNDYFDSESHEKHRDLMHEVFSNITTSISMAERAVNQTEITRIAKQDYQFLDLNYDLGLRKPSDEYINHCLMVITGWSDLAKVTHALMNKIHVRNDIDSWYDNAYDLEHSCLIRAIFNRSRYVLELFEESIIDEFMLCGGNNSDIPLRIN